MSTKKQQYKITNWKDYNKALVHRGSLTVWFEESQQEVWYADANNNKRGAPLIYSDIAIQCGLVIREVFSLPLRATEGFLCSLVDLIKIPLKVPNYTTFCRRQSSLEVAIPHRKPNQPIHVVIDSTGLKVYGEGEWKVRTHGVSKRRTWRKLHVAIDANSIEVLALDLTTNDVSDSEVLPDLLNQIPEDIEVEEVGADGAYDTFDCHKAIVNRGAKALIPPRNGAVEWGEDHPRTELVKQCKEQGKKGWKKSSGYHKRSLAETAMFRFKCIFGSRLKNRVLGHQKTESNCRAAALNKMTFLGMPNSIPVGDCV